MTNRKDIFQIIIIPFCELYIPLYYLIRMHGGNATLAASSVSRFPRWTHRHLCTRCAALSSVCALLSLLYNNNKDLCDANLCRVVSSLWRAVCSE